MFDRKALETLAALTPDHPVVSFYLHLDPRLRGNPDAYKTRVKALLKDAANAIPSADLQAIEDFFEKDFDWSGQGVAVFSSQPADLWQVEQFDVPLRSYVHVGRKPFITPLADVLDTYAAYSVALVEQQTIRLLHFRLGRLIDQQHLDGHEVQRAKGGGGLGGVGRRAGDDIGGSVRETVKGNLKTFAAALVEFCTHHDPKALLVGGADTTVSQFRELLPQAYQDRIKGVISMSTQAPDSEVQAHSLSLMQANHRATQDELVQQLQALDAQKNGGVVGLEKTLQAVYAGRVKTLAMVEGFHAAGKTCPNCGYATTEEVETCVYCEANLDPVQDIAEHAVRKVVEQGGQVQIMNDDSAIVPLGGVGAVFRY